MLVKGAHAAPPVRVPSPCIKLLNMASSSHYFLAFLLLSAHHFTFSWGLTESESLLQFKKSLSNPAALSSWKANSAPCSQDGGNGPWAGVACDGGSVLRVRLEGMSLSGKIDVEALKGLKNLRTVSFMKNNLDGPFPYFIKLPSLRSIYLSDNKFSGEIPDDAFKGMANLRKIYLANNKFSGPIPSSLVSLKRLSYLKLEGNQFTGPIPQFTQSFKSFSIANNDLNGPIPDSLTKLDPASFSGNKGLCGAPLTECKPANPPKASDVPPPETSDPAPTPDKGSKKSLPTTSIVAIVAGVALFLILAALLILASRRKRPAESIEAPAATTPSNLKKKTGLKEPEAGPSGSPEHSAKGSTKAETTAKLSFVRDDREKFDLPDLLKASAEILGSGCFGSSYKAALTTGPVMVVKRFKQMNNVGREEFQEHMRRIGRLRHPNLLPLVAYYYRKEEKLLVTDFVQKGSLAVHLHGHQALGQPSLDWPNRLRIVKGVANALAYLYKELPSIIATHGHIKSSNVLLGDNNEPLLSDYGLVPVINQESAQELMVAYKSPEYLQNGRITKKTDVWGLGILVLEILTGKLPANFVPQNKRNEEQDLATWVHSIPDKNWTDEVLDKEITEAVKNSEGEMLKLLRIGLSCCEGDVETRLDMKEAVARINDIKERDSDEDFLSSYASEGDLRSSRGMSDDFNFS